ncbi:MAG: hypothetical protein ACPGSO_08445 [Vicingaceae bacterium]
MDNIYLIGLILITYPLFGLGILGLKAILKDSNKPSGLIFIPIGASFVLGIFLLGYSISSTL